MFPTSARTASNHGLQNESEENFPPCNYLKSWIRGKRSGRPLVPLPPRRPRYARTSSPHGNAERLGEKKPAMPECAGVDAMADAHREVPLTGNLGRGEFVPRDEHGLEWDHGVLIAMDEQDRRRLAARVARLGFGQMFPADQHSGIGDDRRRRTRASEADVHRHHPALAEADERELRIVEAKPRKLFAQEIVDRRPRRASPLPTFGRA